MERDFDHNLVYSFFRLHPLMTLSTIDGDGRPQTSAVYVYMDEEMNCYCATRETTRKYSNIKDNGIATLSTYDENVIMFGELQCDANVVRDMSEIARVFPELQKIVSSRKSAYWVPPMSQLEGEGYVFLHLKPKGAIFVNYEKSTSEDPQPHKVAFDID